jgi:class 3 adenylate cyclase/TolB-like protein
VSTGRLATIVVVDMQGYTARAEADEARAVATLARLIKRCAKIAKSHRGRVFNTAGDAVMMEFPNVASGLEAAAELVLAPDPAIRVGVHLGEASHMPNGDLLGRGVSVATRMQAHAPPGGVLVSEDARKGLHGPLAERLVAKGEVTLEKPHETFAVYELSQDPDVVARAAAAQRVMQGARRTAIVGMVALGAALAIALARPLLEPPPAPRVAVFSLAAPEDDAALRALASGVADDVALALSATGVQAVARAETAAGAREERLDHVRELGAALALDGVAERAGDTVWLTVSVTRTRDRATLWTSIFRGAAYDLAGLRLRAAVASADVLTCGANALRRRRSEMDSETFSLLLHACGMGRDETKLLEAREAMAQVVAREPRFHFARALLALDSAVASQTAPEPMRTTLRDSARANAERALRADSSIGESYIALSLLETHGNWAARENLLRQGLARDQINGALNTHYAALLSDMGRVAEALPYARRGVMLDPLSRPKRRAVAHLLLLNGDADEAHSIIESMAQGYEEDVGHWRARLHTAFWSDRFDDAIALLDAPASQVNTPQGRACWRQSAAAMRRATSPAEGAAQALACYRSGDLPAEQTLMLLAALGDRDSAFAIARAMFVTGRQGGHDILFGPAAGSLRADPRFMPLMKELGLLRYWRLSAHWPDFCRDPALPYHCEAEAMRLI